MQPTRNHRIVRLVAPMTLGLLLLVTVKVVAQEITPVPLPNPQIPGFTFPTPENVIVGWTTTNNQTAINKHAWGIWTALTLETDQVFDGQKLLVFETWQTPQDIISGSVLAPRPLEAFRQFGHGTAATAGEETVLGFVKYSPTAAKHVHDFNYLSIQKLDSLVKAGIQKIHDFPVTAIALKPVFQPIAKGDLVDGRYYQLAAWPGPGKPYPGKARPFPSTDWKQCVWIDLQNEGKGNGAVDTVCAANGSSRTPANTYSLSSLINFQLTAKEAGLQNTQRIQQWATASDTAAALESGKPLPPKPQPLAEGDYAILVAMHVTSREITRWTWQTFWWTPNPDAPHFPSSPTIANERPVQLQGAARNYAHAPAYSMKNPPQPNTGGQNKGNSVYSYNPWLEAGFSQAVLPDSESGTYDGRPVPNDVGIQSNCMSCHGHANYTLSIGYTGDRYVDINLPRYSPLQVDFLWSIPANAQ